MTPHTPTDQRERRAERTQRPGKHDNGACRSGRQAGSQSGPLAPLTRRQREVYDFCVAFFQEHQRFPSADRISDQFGWSSPNAAQDHLYALERKGAVTRGRLALHGGGRNWMFPGIRVVVLHDGEGAA